MTMKVNWKYVVKKTIGILLVTPLAALLLCLGYVFLGPGAIFTVVVCSSFIVGIEVLMRL